MSNYPVKRIGNYQLLRVIGSGGFGVVYMAKHTALANRIVAIKLLKTSFPSPRDHHRFLAEARILERLQHPHILPIIDVGTDEGISYIVTEYASEGSLRNHLNRRWSLSEAIDIISQVAQALRYAHDRHILHRDLKPENILLKTKGETLLADFGLAIIIDEAHRYASPAPGTPAYMAPEQFEGCMSVASDQYALGCIAYELLTGSAPFSLSSSATRAMWAHKHAAEPPVPPTQRNPLIPYKIEQAILKAMAKQEADRYADVTTFIAALQEAVERDDTQKRDGTGRVRIVGVYEMAPRSISASEENDTFGDGDALALVYQCITKPFIEKALAQLSWLERTCLLLHSEAGFLPHEIAGIVGTSEQQACDALVRGRERMLQNYYRSLEQEHILPLGRLSTSTDSDDARIAVLLNDIPITKPERSTDPAQLQQVQELTTEDDSGSDTEELLERYDPYIVALVEKMAHHNSNLARPEVLDLVIEEIVQNVRIKFWRTLQKKTIQHHEVYIRAIVRNEFTDMLRKRKPPMSSDERSELYAGDSMPTVRETMADPADELEEEERFDEWVDCAASAISALPARQRQAMICLLNEQIGTRIQLVQAFKKHRIDIQSFIWPEDEADKRLLKASVTAARHKIAQLLGVNLVAYKTNGITERALPSSRSRDQFENGGPEGDASCYENGSAPRKSSFFLS